MNADELATAVGNAAAGELETALERIHHCVGQLTDEQIWWRSAPNMNSISNLVLHLTGNLQQWIVHGLTGASDTRNRPAEFADRGSIARLDLMRRLDDVVSRASAVLRGLTAGQLVAKVRIQGFDMTALDAIFNSVPHFRGHTQEIIQLTRQQLGDSYRMAWAPATPEEGAPPA